MTFLLVVCILVPAEIDLIWIKFNNLSKIRQNYSPIYLNIYHCCFNINKTIFLSITLTFYQYWLGNFFLSLRSRPSKPDLFESSSDEIWNQLVLTSIYKWHFTFVLYTYAHTGRGGENQMSASGGGGGSAGGGRSSASNSFYSPLHSMAWGAFSAASASPSSAATSANSATAAGKSYAGFGYPPTPPKVGCN